MSPRVFAPAAVLLCILATSATAECLKAGREDQAAEGRLERVRFTDVAYGNRVEVAFTLNLASLACLEGDDEYDNVPGTLKIHVFSMDKAILARFRANIGRRIRVLGWPFGEHTAHHRAPIVMRVTAARGLP
jgi:hypothetical protein